MVAALKEVKDEKLMAGFNAANQRAIDELHGYVAWLKQQKLPKANERYALGREKYVKLVQYGEMVTLSPVVCWVMPNCKPTLLALSRN